MRRRLNCENKYEWLEAMKEELYYIDKHKLSDVYEELRRVDEEIGKLIDIKDLEKDLKMVEEYREKAVAWKYLLKKRSLVVAEGMQRETATATKKEYPGEIGRPTLTGMPTWVERRPKLEGFCLSEENYDKAVELLKKRFGKGERLIDVHMNNLLALKPLRVTKDVRAFRELYAESWCRLEVWSHWVLSLKATRSYVLQDTAEEMGYECSKKESLRHSLFGGSNTELYEHGVYDIRLSNLDGSYGCNFEALSQDVICDSVPRVHQGKWMQDLSAHDIELTDLHRGPLEILIGADIAGKLLTGEHRRLPSGLVAVQTRLGWTLMGKIPATEEETSETWLLKLSWDEPLPENLSCEFLRWLAKLESLKSIAIPRWLCYREEHRIGTTLHVFCDASRASYATCIFSRIESEQEVTCQLVQARSRVAPLKGTTIPRLELLACLVGARLVNNVVRDLKFEDMERFYWTDSMNALHWIKGKDNWATFRIYHHGVLSRFSGEIEVVGGPELVEKTKKRLAP
ncbi:hypothetical protein LAZ67_9002364 [Cordylochernes scorpioides]|uniref:Peptidase aspartic putative domain-containing protein n=1 Tax=Cordylochernes scorpioides TaxID=51811 RepID=A0ABY6KVS4_9ARAC|nr:hypothetical protein LAZ67_9002364 [Cordylochernes scorpioides]